MTVNHRMVEQYPIACTACCALDAHVFVTIPNVPVLCNVLWQTPQEARNVTRVDVPLALCASCGHVFNPAFDPALLTYDVTYENSLHFSARFQQYADELVQSLIQRHDLRGKQIVEIGSGKGDFLAALCDLGDNTGIGFDPSYSRDAESAYSQRTQFVQDYYSAAYADYAADFICSRHTLEHIPAPGAFVQMLRDVIGPRDTRVFIEVPNGAATLRHLAIWDIIYEHCSYFTAQSLGTLFAQRGFTVTAVEEQYQGQFLTLECVASSAPSAVTVPSAAIEQLRESAADFADAYARKVAQFRQQTDSLRRQGRSAVIWGAGSKGITFLNVLDVADVVRHVVDINPRKHGHFITGAGQEIIPPEQLQQIQPDVIFVMNEIYMAEIQATLDDLGVRAELIPA